MFKMDNAETYLTADQLLSFFYLASTDNISGTTKEIKVHPEPPIDQIIFTSIDYCIVSCPRTSATQTCFKTKEVKSLESR